MNIVDYVILGVMGVSLLFGLYRGFIRSVLNTGGCLISFGLSFVLYPKLAGLIQSDPSLQRTLLTYTDASSRIGDLETAVMNVSQLTQDKINEIVAGVRLPSPLSELLRSNLTNRVYTGISSVSDYVSETILSACINVICFLICFAAVYLVLSLLVNLLHAVFRFPVLKQMDALAGGIFGLLRGVLICFALFSLVPLVQTVLPVRAVSDLIEASRFAPLFNNGSLITAVMNGRL